MVTDTVGTAKRTGTAIVVLVLLSFGLPASSAASSSTVRPEPVPRPGTELYLALGDSLAAGYQPDPAIGPEHGYVALVHRALARDRRLTLRNLGCNGATTTTLLSGGGGCAYDGGVPQLVAAEGLLRRHRHRVRLITIDIGANDVTRCVTAGSVDLACALAALGTAADNLGTIARRLRAAAPGMPIVGMTYYNPYHAVWLRGPAGEAAARQSLQVTTVLNQILTGVYTAAGIRVADVAGAFATADLTTTVPLPDGRVVPVAVARVCAWTWMCVPGRAPDIHPTSVGYRVIADAFLSRVWRADATADPAPTGERSVG
jgi:lysophospholipase L1-like esterase